MISTSTSAVARRASFRAAYSRCADASTPTRISTSVTTRATPRATSSGAASPTSAAANVSNKNLLLSPKAEIDTQPVLEIHADEVKAAHGATVGQLDERALFYLRSRGVPATAARALLIAGFCREALQNIDETDVVGRIDAALSARLPQPEGV